MTRIILAILPVLLIGIMPIYAEEIDVPFIPEGKTCQQSETSTTLSFYCIWVAEKEFGITVVQDDLDADDLQTLEDIREAKENGTYVLPTIDNSWKHTPTVSSEFEDEQAIEKFICTRNSLEPSDVELCRLLEQLDLCNQGYGRLETIQEVRSFVVTLAEPDDLKQWDLKRNQYLKDALMKYEECRATQTEHDVVLSQMYADFIVDDISNNFLYHADFATTDDIYPSQRLTDYSYDRSITRAYSSLCFEENGFGAKFKKQQGCSAEPYEGEYKNLIGGVSLTGDSADIMENYWNCRINEDCTIQGESKYVIIDKIQGDFAVRVNTD